jgi:diguanylate cyclase (GGDEF)-like protein
MSDGSGAKSQLRFPWSGEMDAVTGIPPRKALDHNLPALLRIMGTENLPLSAIMVDIDHFKDFNDKWGHETGDRVLAHVCGLLRKSVLYRGEAYRYGGEEITILLPNAGTDEAMSTAERLRELIYSNPLSNPATDEDNRNVPLAVTISLGVSTFPDVEGSELLVTADQALYVAKKEGRNRAVFFDRSARKDDSPPVTLDVRFPASSAIVEGSYVILTKWFRHRDELTEIEAREISIPGRSEKAVAYGPPPDGGYVTAEIRGRVTAVERRGESTFFSFEVEAEVLNLMYHHLKDMDT